MGDPRIDLSGAPEHQGGNERLIVLFPFFLDRTEVTVGAFRASLLAEKTSSGAVFNPQPAGPGSHCTYRDQPGDWDPLPVNCLSWRLARDYCQKLGKRLPTEAELAYAGSALGTSSYVWGEALPACGEVVFGRGTGEGPCASQGLGPGVVAAASGDQLSLPSGTIADLAGNVMEFAADFWQLDAEPCWRGVGVLWNPSCDTPSTQDRVGRAVRGGSFSDPPLFLRAALRTRIEGESKAVSDRVGFRCARDGF
jgi:formylglycine-generating enzyme required for sulfatase activity